MTHGVVWMENIRRWRVVHDDNRVQVPAESSEVLRKETRTLAVDGDLRSRGAGTHLDVVAPVEDARLPEQPAAEDAPLVQQIGHRICVLATKIESMNIGGI